MEWTPETYAAISAVAAIIAVIVSIISVVSSRAAAREANALERTVVDIEVQRKAERDEDKKKALITLHVEPEIDSMGIRQNLLIVKNIGPCSARNLGFEVRSSVDHTIIQSGEVEIMASYSTLFQRIALSRGTPRPLEVSVKWDDDFEERRETKHSLELALRGGSHH